MEVRLSLFPMSPQKASFGSKLLLSFSFIIISAAYAVWQSMSGVSQTPGTAVTPSQSYKAANDALLQTLSQINNPAATPPPTSASAPAPTSAPAPVKPAGLYADGSYTGSPADAYYGTVQVKAIISGGQIADVQFLQYPSDRSTSRYINGQAMPMLTQEAIQAQSANVSGVSGATATSGAFVQSLASALALAKN